MSEDTAAPVNVIALAKAVYAGDELAEAAKFFEVPADHPDLLPFLGTALDLGLDPFREEIWFLEADSYRATDGHTSQTRYAPFVGRDGLLKKARATEGFKAVRGLAVCENDEFHFIDTGDDVTIHHKVELAKSKEEGDDPSKFRGHVIGAWAKLIMEDRPPTFFYAPIHEFGPEGLDLYADKIEDKFWRYLSTMMLKAAQSYVLRIGIGATGFVALDERRANLEAKEAVTGESMAAEVLRIIHTQLDPSLPKELLSELDEATAEANHIEHASWNPAKVSMRLIGQPEEKAREVLAEIKADIERWKSKDEPKTDPAVLADIPAGELQKGMILVTEDGDLRIDHVEHTAKTVKLRFNIGKNQTEQRKRKDSIVQIRPQD